MKVKGTVIAATKKFVESRYGERYKEWLEALTPESREVMERGLASEWYPLQHAMVTPTEVISDLFYKGDPKAAWDLGRYSADFALRGIYKLFVRIGSPHFIIKRGSKVFSTYYDEAELEVVDVPANGCTVHVVRFGEPHVLVDGRIAGWMQRAVEISGAKNVKGEVTRSMARGDELTEFVFSWE